ncbi:hypothetical protein NJB93_18720 [Brucella intermedia]|uniref:hypothetical protein n=1 Tax=Brucella intermedia TaxID=94625 RepID=UPI00209AD10F|nr:hypothetical protein [Brucella intermedia]MCO7728622.1 hypothetical protein [Brucella intermedia]
MLYVAYMAKDTQYPVRKLAYFSEDMAEAIADFRFKNRITSENEAIRRLIHTGLEARPILLDIQKMLVKLRPLGGESELDEHIGAIQRALNPE